MRVDLSFHHPDSDPKAMLDFEVARDLEALPRMDDQVLWTDVVADEERWSRVYVVRGVDWSMGSDTEGSAIRVRLDFLAEG